MSHRVIIADSLRVAFQEPEVREHLTTSQCTKVDQICAQADPADDDFRYLLRRLGRVYCHED
jgi:hypothetical protein